MNSVEHFEHYLTQITDWHLLELRGIEVRGPGPASAGNAKVLTSGLRHIVAMEIMRRNLARAA